MSFSLLTGPTNTCRMFMPLGSIRYTFCALKSIDGYYQETGERPRWKTIGLSTVLSERYWTVKTFN